MHSTKRLLVLIFFLLLACGELSPTPTDPTTGQPTNYSPPDVKLTFTPVLTKSDISDQKPIENKVITSSVYLIVQSKPPKKEARTWGQIWELFLDKEKIRLRNQVTRNTSKDITQMLPASEIELFQQFVNQPPISETVLKSYKLTSYMNDFALSPTADLLVTNNTDGYCKFHCFGVQSLILFELEAEQSKELLQIPNHVEGNLRQFYNLNTSAWSPNGQYIALTRKIRPSNPGYEDTPIVIELKTGHVQEMPSGRGTDSVSWSPDSTMISWAFTQYDYVNAPSDMIQTCRVNDGECQAIETNVFFIHDLHWSPNGNQIAFIARSEASTEDNTIYRMDIKSGQIQPVPVMPNLDIPTVPSRWPGIEQEKPYFVEFANLKWSPDGQLIAVEYKTILKQDAYKGGVPHFQNLIIIKPETGQIIAHYSRETDGLKNVTPYGVDHFKWVWGAENRSIIAVVQTDTGKSELKSLNVYNRTVETTIPLNELNGMDIDVWMKP